MELSLQKLRSLWQSIRTRAEAEKSSLRAGLSRATVVALDGDVLTLRVPDPPAGEVDQARLATVKKAIAESPAAASTCASSVGSGATPPPDGGFAPTTAKMPTT